MIIIEIIKYLLIGAIQGFLEPLPVSSSAHMIIFADILNISNNDLTFEIVINFASFLAILIFLFKDIKNQLITENKINYPFITKLAIASFPAVIVGFIIKDLIGDYLMSTKAVGYTLIITTIFLLITILLYKRTQKQKITYLDALVIGTFQAVALAPGISRSGTTLMGGTICRVNANTTLTFSFMMYLVVSLGAMFISLGDVIASFAAINIGYYLVAFISAFIGTSIAVKWFYQIISKRTLWLFAIYTFIVGTIIIIIK